MKRSIFKLLFVFIFILIGFFISSVINWNKLSYDTPIKTSNRNLYLKNVDSTFVAKYNIEYNNKFVYFIRGDIEINTYKGDIFLTKKVIVDTVNVVLDKKLKRINI